MPASSSCSSSVQLSSLGAPDSLPACTSVGNVTVSCRLDDGEESVSFVLSLANETHRARYSQLKEWAEEDINDGRGETHEAKRRKVDETSKEKRDNNCHPVETQDSSPQILRKRGEEAAPATDHERKERASVMDRVGRDGMSLRFLEEKWRADREVVLEAVKDTGEALAFAPAEF
ncbi:unnamed protein product, partial [Amoebophrya sp. A25]|eukprot:GSA25T00022489001.1